MRFSDLITSEKTGRLSTTKIWMNVANVILSYVMLKQDAVGADLILAYGVVVGGSYLGAKYMNMRNGNVGNSHSGRVDNPD